MDGKGLGFVAVSVETKAGGRGRGGGREVGWCGVGKGSVKVVVKAVVQGSRGVMKCSCTSSSAHCLLMRDRLLAHTKRA